MMSNRMRYPAKPDFTADPQYCCSPLCKKPITSSRAEFYCSRTCKEHAGILARAATLLERLSDAEVIIALRGQQ